jgi:hypothetical protein
LNGWRGPYPPEVFADQFEKIAVDWQPGIEALREAVRNAPSDQRNEAEADLRYAQAAAIHFQSVANQARFVHARDTLADSSTTLSESQREELLKTIDQTLTSEIELARELYSLVQQDSRIGFEPSCQYFYLPLDLVEKVVNCRWLLNYFGAQQRTRNG